MYFNSPFNSFMKVFYDTVKDAVVAAYKQLSIEIH
jgi:hypothetical protein